MQVNRREFLSGTSAIALGLLAGKIGAQDSDRASTGVRFCLNTSTIRGQNLALEEEVDLVARLGYDGIEPWIREIETHRASGKSLDDLRRKIADHGLQVESAIGFANWIVNDDSERAKGVEQLKRDMELVRSIGGTRIAAPPVGAHRGDAEELDLFAVAERYHAILEIGREIGVTPQVEIWGSSKNLSRLGEAVFVAVESGHPDACILPDVYHIYRGGSPFDGLGLLSSAAIHCFHFNDYPGVPPREELGDADRVYPGAGAAPWREIIGMLTTIGFQGAVSLELFNRDYWQQPAEAVAKTGLQRMQAVFADNA